MPTSGCPGAAGRAWWWLTWRDLAMPRVRARERRMSCSPPQAQLLGRLRPVDLRRKADRREKPDKPDKDERDQRPPVGAVPVGDDGDEDRPRNRGSERRAEVRDAA